MARGGWRQPVVREQVHSANGPPSTKDCHLAPWERRLVSPQPGRPVRPKALDCRICCWFFSIMYVSHHHSHTATLHHCSLSVKSFQPGMEICYSSSICQLLRVAHGCLWKAFAIESSPHWKMYTWLGRSTCDVSQAPRSTLNRCCLIDTWSHACESERISPILASEKLGKLPKIILLANTHWELIYMLSWPFLKWFSELTYLIHTKIQDQRPSCCAHVKDLETEVQLPGKW